MVPIRQTRDGKIEKTGEMKGFYIPLKIYSLGSMSSGKEPTACKKKIISFSLFPFKLI
jgi:hypothetical protein